ncbi:MAG: helix-turn-helix domain-containing protein [Candidatus Dormibacteria bacterium]
MNTISQHIHRPSTLTPAERQRHKELRERFQRELPSLEQLVASGEYTPPIPHGVHLEILHLRADLRRVREASGLSLSELAARTGLDAAVWQRLESGGPDSLTVELVLRYAQALGKRLVWRLEDADDPAAAMAGGR